MGCSLEYAGRERTAPRPVLVLSNYSSMDLYGYWPRFVGLEELWRVLMATLLGTGCRGSLSPCVHIRAP